jgi:phage baseplate assembly protein V
MTRQGERETRAMLAPLERRMSAVAARAVVRQVDDSNSRQLLQLEILKGEVRDLVERLQNYGLASHPHPGADAAVISLGGHRDQSIVIAVEDRRFRLTGLEAGEVALYDDLGNRVLLLRDRMRLEGKDIVEVVAPKANIQADTTTIDGDLVVNGDTTFNGTVAANGKRIDDTHTHVGVTPGGGVSGTPS